VKALCFIHLEKSLYHLLRCSLSRLAMAAFAAFALGCNPRTGSGPVEPIVIVPVQNNVVITRANQTPISFANNAKLSVWCGAWEPGVPTPSVHIRYGGPSSTDPYWYVRAVVADLGSNQAFPFPNTFIFDQPDLADIFVFDPPNELSTQTKASSGTISFQEVNCASGGFVQFVVSTIIGSEFGGGPTVTAIGTFRGAVGQPPQ
jgi:hypothetical protein